MEDLYYHTDHHWTTQGAYYAYLKAAKDIGIDTSADTYDKAPVTRSFQGTLSAKSGFRSGEKDEIDVFLPTGDQALSSVVNYVDEQKKVPASMILRNLRQEINMHYSLVETTLR